MRSDVARQRLGVEQVALLGATARVTDHPRRAAGQGDRHVAEQLESTQQQERHEVADMQALGGRIEARVDGEGTLA